MIFNELPLVGAYVIAMQCNEDSRGFFARIFCEQEFEDRGLNSKWTQMNNSFSEKAGTLRGLHLQNAPYSEVKAVRCIKGSIWDVMVDLREGSSTLGCWYGLELSEKNRLMAYVPKGFAHGFLTLTDHTEVMYLVSAPYSKDHEIGLRWDDKKVDIKWPLLPICISAKDECNLSFNDILDKLIIL
jgi:dTDP-4-dehydrorhamnose 3,5-epimerase